MKKLIYIFTLIMLLSPFICLSQTFEDLADRMEEALDSNNYIEVLNLLNQAIDKTTKDYEIYDLIIFRGNMYIKMEDIQKAFEEYRKAANLVPGKPDAYLCLGIVYQNLGYFDTALFYYDKVIKIDPVNYNVYKYRGGLYYSKGEYKKAIADFTKALEYIHVAEIYNKRGQCYALLFDFKKAISDFTKSIDLEPDNADTYILRALSYSGLKDNEKEIADYTRYIELNPDNFYAYRYRGMTYFDLKEYLKAAEDFSIAIELITKKINTENSGEFIIKIDTTGSCVNKVSYDPDTIVSPAKVIESKNADYKENTAEAPEEILTELLVYRASCYTKVSNYEKARQDYLQLYGIYPDRPISMDLLGWNCRKCDMQDSAIFYFKKAIEMDSLDKDALIGLALAYYCNEEYDSSKDVLSVLIDLVPELNSGIAGIKKLDDMFWYSDSEKVKIKEMLEFYGY